MGGVGSYSVYTKCGERARTQVFHCTCTYNKQLQFEQRPFPLVYIMWNNHCMFVVFWLTNIKWTLLYTTDNTVLYTSKFSTINGKNIYSATVFSCLNYWKGQLPMCPKTVTVSKTTWKLRRMIVGKYQQQADWTWPSQSDLANVVKQSQFD